MIAVHCGAGKHSSKHQKKYNRLCSRACVEGMTVLKNGGTPLEAVKAAVTILENDAMTNAGYGSNLTVNGYVEGDAAVMDGKTLVYGGCGSVRKVKNPIHLAYDICIKQFEDNMYGLVPPSLLVGSGALDHAKQSGLKIVKNKELVSLKASRQMKKYKALTEETDTPQKLDTVGAVCCGLDGNVAAASSSGGLILKKDGRVGQAALYASGVWADSYSFPTETSLAVCTTGCGEQLVQTQLAKQISEDLKTCTCPTIELSKCITEKFINSKFLHRAIVKSAGALVLHLSGDGEGSVLWGHNTETMSVGFMRDSDPKPSSLVSQLQSSSGDTPVVMEMPRPVKVMPISEPRSTPRRIVPKGNMRQIAQTISSGGEPETLEILSDDDDVQIAEGPVKKKYRVCSNNKDAIVIKATKPPEPTLSLDCWEENLSSVQLALQKSMEKEYTEMTNKIDNYLTKSNAEVIFEGELISAIELDAPLSTSISQKSQKAAKSNGPTTLPAPPAPAPVSNYSYVLDPRSGQVVGTVTSAPTVVAQGQIVGAITPTASSNPPQLLNRQTRKRTRANSPPPQPPQTIKLQKLSQPPPLVTLRQPDSSKTTPKTTASVVDLTSDELKNADSKEVAFNKLQGKTFPSLVVVARPNLKNPATNIVADRTKLDIKVKSVLMHAPTKFTEWLIQQGLIRAEQVCPQHQKTKLKLGMYSDASKFPFSGGYVWISECCPQRFVSVFSGSIFEGSPHPPSVLLKLVYHWSCQTNVQNVIQWVKVENLYVKGLNTWLRAVCTVALHTHVPQLGGPGIRVEIGVISLGTTSQDGNQRQVKVEVLGILESFTKRIRLRAVEPLTEQDRSLKKRFVKILEPLNPWVHPDSIIVTDMTVDKATLQSMGFKNIQQESNNSKGNSQIMDYLRRIVPRMFQNTLSLLSRQIIQQFLDELVWREWFGTTPSDTFDNLLLHLAEQTRTDCGQSLVVRLNKVATNPFRSWGIATNTNTNKYTIEAPKRQRRKQQINRVYTPTPELLKPARSTSPDFPEQTVPLEHYYYGTIEGVNDAEVVAFNVKCHVCKEPFNSNIELMKHYFNHAHNITTAYQCKYCLAGVTTKEGLESHVLTTHPSTTKVGNEFVCIICESKFNSTYLLGKHMSIEHVPSELPYQCGTCNFRSSSHKQTIDHFYTMHANQGVLQCPFCLKSTVLATSGRATPQHLYYFLQHLQKHQKKAVAKKCNKCSLWFVQQNGAKDHMKMHETQRRKAGLKPWLVPRHCIMVPKSVNEDKDEETDISNLEISVPENTECKECNAKLTEKDHFPAVLSCENDTCEFITCCKNAMVKHTDNCKTIGIILPELPLPFEMFCVCGHSNKDGNAMAKHLAVCERHSAYPSREAAKTATVTHSMLDVLGLVRRPEEPASSSDTVLSDEDKSSKTKSDDDNTSEKGSEKLKKRKRTMIKGYKKPNRVVDITDGENSKEKESSDVMKVTEELADKENKSLEENTNLENISKDENSPKSDEVMDVDNESNNSKETDESANLGAITTDKSSEKKDSSDNASNSDQAVTIEVADEESIMSENNAQVNEEETGEDISKNVESNENIEDLPPTESQNDLDLTDVAFIEKDLHDIQTDTDKDNVNLEDILSNAEDKMLEEQSEDVDGLLNDIMESECAKSSDISDVMLID